MVTKHKFNQYDLIELFNKEIMQSRFIHTDEGYLFYSDFYVNWLENKVIEFINKEKENEI